MSYTLEKIWHLGSRYNFFFCDACKAASKSKQVWFETNYFLLHRDQWNYFSQACFRYIFSVWKTFNYLCNYCDKRPLNCFQPYVHFVEFSPNLLKYHLTIFKSTKPGMSFCFYRINTGYSFFSNQFICCTAFKHSDDERFSDGEAYSGTGAVSRSSWSKT